MNATKLTDSISIGTVLWEGSQKVFLKKESKLWVACGIWVLHCFS